MKAKTTSLQNHSFAGLEPSGKIPNIACLSMDSRTLIWPQCYHTFWYFPCSWIQKICTAMPQSGFHVTDLTQPRSLPGQRVQLKCCCHAFAGAEGIQSTIPCPLLRQQKRKSLKSCCFFFFLNNCLAPSQLLQNIPIACCQLGKSIGLLMRQAEQDVLACRVFIGSDFHWVY